MRGPAPLPKAYLIALLGLCACGPRQPTPPLGPEGEVAVATPPGQGVEHCMTVLHSLTDRGHGHIDRSLITSSPRWGLLFRADFSSGAHPGATGRLVCPIGSHAPVMISLELNVPPLASGPWGKVTTYP